MKDIFIRLAITLLNGIGRALGGHIGVANARLLSTAGSFSATNADWRVKRAFRYCCWNPM
ncbi:MAG: hypothetical protein KGL13_10025 [Gammaproteobacteria bacterium]|nr:hypothetical protein [Gammaproteobacteria bacterium]